jgi:hypothetical protein
MLSTAAGEMMLDLIADMGKRGAAAKAKGRHLPGAMVGC